jgi:hypothetical protein
MRGLIALGLTIAGVAWAWARSSHGSGGTTSSSGASARPLARFVWRQEEARVAAYAAWLNQIFAPEQIAQVIGTTLYPDAKWPPPAGAELAQRRFWTKARKMADAVAADPMPPDGGGQ